VSPSYLETETDPCSGWRRHCWAFRVVTRDQWKQTPRGMSMNGGVSPMSQAFGAKPEKRFNQRFCLLLFELRFAGYFRNQLYAGNGQSTTVVGWYTTVLKPKVVPQYANRLLGQKSSNDCGVNELIIWGSIGGSKGAEAPLNFFRYVFDRWFPTEKRQLGCVFL